MIALVVFTDGRWDELDQTLVSAGEALHGPISSRTLVIDGEHGYVPKMPAGWDVIEWHRRLGFAGTIHHLWRMLADGGGPARYVFHLEDDFTFNRDVDLGAMAHVLDENRDLLQLALRRQPVNVAEQRAGGVVEQWPEEYTDCGDDEGNEWLEHRLFWTTNPSLYPRAVTRVGWPWPNIPRSEQAFTARLLTDPTTQFGYWGHRSSGEWVRHIGATRVGTGY